MDKEERIEIINQNVPLDKFGYELLNDLFDKYIYLQQENKQLKERINNAIELTDRLEGFCDIEISVAQKYRQTLGVNQIKREKEELNRMKKIIDAIHRDKNYTLEEKKSNRTIYMSYFNK